MKKRMRFLSLFSGIEAASVAWPHWECVAVAEIEPFPCAVIKERWPGLLNLGDVTQITEAQIQALGHIDVVVFGFPCQDLSIAGQQKGMKNADGTNTRSGLFYSAEQIALWARARWTVVENVPGMFSSNGGRDFASVVGELVGSKVGVPRNGWGTSGVAVGDKGIAEWAVLDAQWHGLAQRRKRVFVVRDSRGIQSNRPPLFLKPESLRGYPSPSREEGQRTAAAPGHGSAGGGGTDTPPGPAYSIAGNLINRGDAAGPEGVGVSEELAYTLTRNDRSGVCAPAGPPVPLADVSGTVSSKWAKGTGGPAGDECYNLVAAQPSCTFLWMAGVCSDPGGADGDVSSTLVKNQTLAVAQELPVAYQQNISGEIRDQGQTNGTIRANASANTNIVGTQYAVRRLTPVECEKLQGFPPGFTRIPFNGKPAEKCPDGVRYKALGNSMATNVMAYIGKLIEQADSVQSHEQTQPL